MQNSNNEPDQVPIGPPLPQPPPLPSKPRTLTGPDCQRAKERVGHSPSDSKNNFVTSQLGNISVASRPDEFVDAMSLESQTQGERPTTLPAHIKVVLGKVMNQEESRRHVQTSERRFRGYNQRDNCVDFFDITVTKCSVRKESLRELGIHPSMIMPRETANGIRQTTNTAGYPHLKSALLGNSNNMPDVLQQYPQYSHDTDNVSVTCDPTTSDYSQYAYDCPEWSRNTRVPNRGQAPPDRPTVRQGEVRRTGTPELQLTVASLQNSPAATKENPLDLSRKKESGEEILSDKASGGDIQFIDNVEEKQDETRSAESPEVVFVSEQSMYMNTRNTSPAVDLFQNSFKFSKGIRSVPKQNASKPIQHSGSETANQQTHASAVSLVPLPRNQRPYEGTVQPDTNTRARLPQPAIPGPGYPSNPYEPLSWPQPGPYMRPPPGLLVRSTSQSSNRSHPEVVMQCPPYVPNQQSPLPSQPRHYRHNIPYRPPVNHEVRNQEYPPFSSDGFRSTGPYVRGRAPHIFPESPVYYPHNTTARGLSAHPKPMWSPPLRANNASLTASTFNKPFLSAPQEQHARSVSQPPLPQSWYASPSFHPSVHSVSTPRPELAQVVAAQAQWPPQTKPPQPSYRVDQQSAMPQSSSPIHVRHQGSQQASALQSLSSIIRSTLEQDSSTSSLAQENSVQQSKYSTPKQPLADQTTATTLQQPQSSSSVTRSPPAEPQSASAVSQSPSAEAQSPLLVPQSPLLVPQSPSLVPQSPSPVPQSPSLAPQSPSLAPQSSFAEPSLPFSEPQSPFPKPQSPSSVPQSQSPRLESPSSDSGDSMSKVEMPLLLAIFNSAPIHKEVKSATTKQRNNPNEQTPPSNNAMKLSKMDNNVGSSSVVNDITDLRRLLLDHDQNTESGKEGQIPSPRQFLDDGPYNYNNPQMSYYWDCLQTTLPSPFDNPESIRTQSHLSSAYPGKYRRDECVPKPEVVQSPRKRRQEGDPEYSLVLNRKQMKSWLDELESEDRGELIDTDGDNRRSDEVFNRVNSWDLARQAVTTMPTQGMEVVQNAHDELTSSFQPLDGPALLMANMVLPKEKPLRPPPPLIKIEKT
ncbi:melanoma-associated antigen C1-like [Branchiostoma lanceolatum]|uniref:melanoma-associated antigen C1-like n=1 Tax=Branchiostoma lanceolatum TaxID=7740 RepID=UPI003455557B